MFKDMSKIMTWHIWEVTHLRRNVTIVCGISYHLLGFQISWDSKIRFQLQVKSYISDWWFSKSQHLASYVSCRHGLWQCLVDECLEGWVHLGGSCFPVKFLEEEDVGLDKVADGVHDDLLIGIWKFTNPLDFLALFYARCWLRSLCKRICHSVHLLNTWKHLCLMMSTKPRVTRCRQYSWFNRPKGVITRHFHNMAQN